MQGHWISVFPRCTPFCLSYPLCLCPLRPSPWCGKWHRLVSLKMMFQVFPFGTLLFYAMNSDAQTIAQNLLVWGFKCWGSPLAEITCSTTAHLHALGNRCMWRASVVHTAGHLGLDAGLALDRDFLTLDMRWTCPFDTYPYPTLFPFFHGAKLVPRFLLHAVGSLQFPFRPPSVPAPRDSLPFCSRSPPSVPAPQKSRRRACLPPQLFRLLPLMYEVFFLLAVVTVAGKNHFFAIVKARQQKEFVGLGYGSGCECFCGLLTLDLGWI